MSATPTTLPELNVALSRARIPVILDAVKFQRLIGSLDANERGVLMERLQASDGEDWFRAKCEAAQIHVDSGGPAGIGQGSQPTGISPASEDDVQESPSDGSGGCRQDPRGHGRAAGAPGREAAFGDDSRGALEREDQSFEASQHRKHHVYARTAALCWEEDRTRGDVLTVALEGALSKHGGGYDWQQKIRLQLTERELTVVASVLLGLSRGCSFSAHGPRKDKGFQIERQEQATFVKVMTKGIVVAVPMAPEDSYKVLTLVLMQMTRNAPWMTATGIIEALKAQFG